MIKKSTITALVPLVETTLYTVPSGKGSELVMLWLSNPDTNNKGLTLKAYNSSTDSSVTILEDYTVNSKDFVQIGGTENSYIVMAEGDKILATGASNSAFTIVCSFKEHNNIIQGG